LLAVAALALIADPLYRDVRLNLLLGVEDTRVTARNWLRQHYGAVSPCLVRDSKAMPGAGRRWRTCIRW
jgi:hypothetical protein